MDDAGINMILAVVIVLACAVLLYFVGRKKSRCRFILETNAKTVSAEKKNGENLVYGDASHEAVLDFVEQTGITTCAYHSG